ncbi:MAG: hypothetical protein Q3993_00765 [Filifactor alocis]|nr:hypothetical protein [Filifactor alocis]
MKKRYIVVLAVFLILEAALVYYPKIRGIYRWKQSSLEYETRLQLKEEALFATSPSLPSQEEAVELLDRTLETYNIEAKEKNLISDEGKDMRMEYLFVADDKDVRRLLEDEVWKSSNYKLVYFGKEAGDKNLWTIRVKSAYRNK